MFKKTFTIIITFILGLLIFSSCESPKEQSNIISGDILFQDLDCGPLCDAIESVTFGKDSAKFSHIGFVIKQNDTLKVIEAIGGDSKLSILDSFLFRSIDKANQPKVWVGRLDPKYNSVLKKALKLYSKYLNYPYDDEFIYDNGKYYCSELIYDLFREANSGEDFFKLEPMTFKNLKTHEFLKVWIDYYSDLKMEIPQGELGINPAGISRDEKLHIILKLGEVSKH